MFYILKYNFGRRVLRPDCVAMSIQIWNALTSMCPLKIFCFFVSGPVHLKTKAHASFCPWRVPYHKRQKAIKKGMKKLKLNIDRVYDMIYSKEKFYTTNFKSLGRDKRQRRKRKHLTFLFIKNTKYNLFSIYLDILSFLESTN